MLSPKAKAAIDALTIEELRFEVARGRESRFQREKFAYLQVRLARLEEERMSKRQEKADAEDPLPPEPPAILRKLRWLMLHGTRFWRYIALAAFLAIVSIFVVPMSLDYLGEQEQRQGVEPSSDELDIRILGILAEPNEGQLYSDTVLALRLSVDPNRVSFAAERLAENGLILRVHRLPQDDYVQSISDSGRRFLVERLDQ